MKALDKTTLEKQYTEIQTASELIQRQIVELQAERATLQRTLSRIELNIQAVGTRPVPSYAPWLQMKPWLPMDVRGSF
jgi:hypothetical protein